MALTMLIEKHSTNKKEISVILKSKSTNSRKSNSQYIVNFMMKVHNSSHKKLKFTIYWEFPCLSNKYLVFLFQIHNILGI